jgi:hypothetical protein
MQQHSLFGHLVPRFSSQPENMATEALHYILNSSSIAKRAFLHYIAQIGISLPDTLVFQTQMAGADNAIPDLAGIDAERQQVLLVEAKFWAGLTNNQLLTYLRRLPDHTDGILLFLAPAMRFPILWSELLRRCQEHGLPVEQPHTIGGELLAVKVGPTQTLALTSWRAVLVYLLRALETEGQHQAASDVQQLYGLCSRMDDHAFLPLHSEDLTAQTGARIAQYCQFVDEVTSKAVAAGFASVTGLRSAAGWAWYGRYLRLHTTGCLLQFAANLWAQLRSTPLWLRIYGREFSYAPESKAALARLEFAEPPRLILRNTDELLVPLFLPIEVERDQVVAAVFTQVKEVADLLHPIAESE